MTRIQKNESVADRRRVVMRLYLDDGVTPAPAATAFFWERAVLSLSGLSAVFASSSVNYDTPGVVGNGVQLAFAADGAGAGSVTSSGLHYTFHFAPGVTTAANASAALVAFGLNIFGVYTGGATLATPGDVFSLHALTGGVDTSIFLMAAPGFGEVQSDSTGDFENVVDISSTPIDGYFVYIPTQAETSVGSNELDVRVNKPGVKAALNVGGITTHCNDIIEDKTPGSQGNNTTLAFVNDGSGAGTLDESAYPTVIFHYQSGTTTVTNFETAVTASTHLAVRTAGTGANVLSNPGDTFAAHAFSGGIGYSQATFPVEIADDTLASIIEGAHTGADLIRLLVSVIAGKVSDFRTGTLAFRDLGDAKTRLTVTTDPSGRTAIVIGDLTP